MRDIKFRGKRIDNNEWVYGNLIKGENCYISTKEDFYNAVVTPNGRMCTVINIVQPDTIGQFIMKDLNENDVYENDYIYFEETECGEAGTTIDYSWIAKIVIRHFTVCFVDVNTGDEMFLIDMHNDGIIDGTLIDYKEERYENK